MCGGEQTIINAASKSKVWYLVVTTSDAVGAAVAELSSPVGTCSGAQTANHFLSRL